MGPCGWGCRRRIIPSSAGRTAGVHIMSEADYRTELETAFPLDGVGTRFEHYNELREVFAEGIEILTTTLSAHKSASDVIKLAELKAAEKMIVKRLEVLSGYERKTVYSGVL